MKFSRRGFLTGAVAVATAAALPVPALAKPKLVVDPSMFARGGYIKPYRYNGPFYYLHKSEWAYFERSGFNMNLCRLIGQIPIPRGHHA